MKCKYYLEMINGNRIQLHFSSVSAVFEMRSFVFLKTASDQNFQVCLRLLYSFHMGVMGKVKEFWWNDNSKEQVSFGTFLKTN